MPFEVRRSGELWVGCGAGALEESTYRSKLSRAGFEAVDLETMRIYRAVETKALSRRDTVKRRDHCADRRSDRKRVAPRLLVISCSARPQWKWFDPRLAHHLQDVESRRPTIETHTIVGAGRESLCDRALLRRRTPRNAACSGRDRWPTQELSHRAGVDAAAAVDGRAPSTAAWRPLRASHSAHPGSSVTRSPPGSPAPSSTAPALSAAAETRRWRNSGGATTTGAS